MVLATSVKTKIKSQKEEGKLPLFADGLIINYETKETEQKLAETTAFLKFQDGIAKMATFYSSIAWKFLTEEPGGLQSVGSQDWARMHEGAGSNKQVEPISKKKKKVLKTKDQHARKTSSISF